MPNGFGQTAVMPAMPFGFAPPDEEPFDVFQAIDNAPVANQPLPGFPEWKPRPRIEDQLNALPDVDALIRQLDMNAAKQQRASSYISDQSVIDNFGLTDGQLQEMPISEFQQKRASMAPIPKVPLSDANLDLIERAQQGLRKYDAENPGKAWGRYFADRAIPGFSTGKQLGSAWHAKAAADKIDSQPLSEEEALLLARYLNDQEDNQKRGEDKTPTLGGYGPSMGTLKQAGNMLAEQPAFWGEMALTGGLGGPARAAIRGVGAKLLARQMAKRTVGGALARTAIKSAGAAADIAARTALMPQRVAKTAVERQIRMPGDKRLREAWGESFGHGAFQNSVELLSEIYFGKLLQGLVGKPVGYVSKKLAEKTPALDPLRERLVKAWSSSVGKSLQSGYERVAKAGGWNGIIGEVGEERFNEVVLGLAGELGLKGQEYDFGATGHLANGDFAKAWKQIGPELIAFGLPGAAVKAARFGIMLANLSPKEKEAAEQFAEQPSRTTYNALPEEIKQEAVASPTGQVEAPQRRELAEGLKAAVQSQRMTPEEWSAMFDEDGSTTGEEVIQSSANQGEAVTPSLPESQVEAPVSQPQDQGASNVQEEGQGREEGLLEPVPGTQVTTGAVEEPAAPVVEPQIEQPVADSLPPPGPSPSLLQPEVTSPPLTADAGSAAKTVSDLPLPSPDQFREMRKQVVAKEGKRDGEKYLNAVDRLFPASDIIEYRSAGPVVKRGNRAILAVLADTDSHHSKWRVADEYDVTDQFQTKDQTAGEAIPSAQAVPESPPASPTAKTVGKRARTSKVSTPETPPVVPSEVSNVQPTDTADALLSREARRYSDYARPYEGGKGLAVGSEGIDYRWKEAAMLDMRNALREGKTLDEAETIAKEKARGYIKQHNASRPKDINWARWEGAADGAIETAKRQILELQKNEPVQQEVPAAARDDAEAQASGERTQAAASADAENERQALDKLDDRARSVIADIDQGIADNEADISDPKNAKKPKAWRQVRERRIAQGKELRTKVLADGLSQPEATEGAVTPAETPKPVAPERPAWFERLVTSNYDRLTNEAKKIASARGLSSADAEDAANNAMAKVLEKWEAYKAAKTPAAFRKWAGTILSNELANIGREKSADQKAKEAEADRLLDEAAAQSKQNVRKALDNLSKAWKEGFDKPNDDGSLGTLNAPLLPLPPGVAKALGELAVALVDDGKVQFKLFVRAIRKQFNGTIPEAVKQRLVSVWNKARSRMPELDEATDTALTEVLGEDSWNEQIDEAIDAQDAKRNDAAEPEPAGDGFQESTKNAYSEKTREELGEPPREKPVTVPYVDIVDQAKAIGQNQPHLIDDLIFDLEANPRQMTYLQESMLLYRKVELRNKRNEALATKDDATDPAERSLAEKIANALAQEEMQIVKLLEFSGSEWGRHGAHRRKVVNEDFTLAQSELEYRATHDGAAPPDDVMQQLREQERIRKELEAELEKEQAAHEATREKLALLEAHKKAVTDVKGDEHKPGATKKPATRTAKAQEKVKAAIADFLNSVKGKAFSIETAVGEVSLKAAGVVKAYAELGYAKFADFMEQLVKDAGEQMRQYRDVFHSEWHKQTLGEITADIPEDVDMSEPTSLNPITKQLHRFVIERDNLTKSEADRDKAVAAVHEILTEFIPEITNEQVARSMSGIGEFSELSKDQTDVIRREQRRQLQLLEKIADAKAKVLSPKTGVEREKASDEVRRLMRELNEAKKNFPITAEAKKNQLQSALSSAMAAVRNRIRDLSDALYKLEPIDIKPRTQQTNEKLTKLRDERDELKALYDEAFGKRELSDVQRLERAERIIDRLMSDVQKEIDSGNFEPKPKRAQPTSPALEAKRAELRALRARRDELRAQSGDDQARSDAAYERILTTREAYWAKKAAEKDFQPTPKKPERQLTARHKELRFKIDEHKAAIKKMRDKWQLDNRLPVKKATDGIRTALRVWRKWMTAWDNSLIGRQGWPFVVTHPWLSAKAIRSSFSNPFKAKTIFTTPEKLHAVYEEMRNDSEWMSLAKRGKLEITDVAGDSNREEGNQGVPEWVNKVPGLGGSERSGAAFINVLRMSMFQFFVNRAMQKGTVSTADLEFIANAINTTTGRASLGKYANSSLLLSDLFFSPRWWVSRLQMATGAHVWATGWKGQKDGEAVSGRVRAMMASEWGKQMAATTAFIGLIAGGLSMIAGAPGPDKEWDWFGDPRNPNFGKLRVGNTYIDFTAGIAPLIAFARQMQSGETINHGRVKETDRLRLGSRYVVNKLAPVPSAVGDVILRKAFGGAKPGTAEWLYNKMVPLIGQEAAAAIKAEGWSIGSIMSSLVFFGPGVKTGDPYVKDRRDAADEIRWLRLRANASPGSAAQLNEQADRLLHEHLRSAVVNELKMDLKATRDNATAEKYANLIREAEYSKPNTPVSPELQKAFDKEKQDIVMRAVQRLSTEPGRDAKSPRNDISIESSRELLKEIAKTPQAAISLFDKAKTEEVLSGKVKKIDADAAKANRRRIMQLYGR